jgi:hypothetical protein
LRAICLRPNIAQPAHASSGLPCQNAQLAQCWAALCCGYFFASTLLVPVAERDGLFVGLVDVRGGLRARGAGRGGGAASDGQFDDEATA